MNQPMRCLIVDDEPSAQQILRQYISDSPQAQAVGCCGDAIEALEFLNNHNVDLLFLDINMPKLSGISFLKSFDDPPPVILTTAYEEYALQGYELDVIDYLLKPFSFERFLKAISKAESRLAQKIEPDTFFTIKADKKTYRIAYDDILFIESAGDYVTLHCRDQKLTGYGTMINLEKILPPDQFYRVHKSFIISASCIEYIEGNSIKIGKTYIPIGTTYQEEIKKKILG